MALVQVRTPLDSALLSDAIDRRGHPQARDLETDFDRLANDIQKGRFCKGDGARAITLLNGHRKWLRRIAARQPKASFASLRELGALMMASHQSRVAAVLRTAGAGRHERLPHQMPFTLSQVEAEAALIDVARPLPGAMTVRSIAKENGGIRPICRLSGSPTAAQLLVSDFLTIAQPTYEWDFARRGRGRAIAATTIQRCVDGGFRYWLVFDVANFFGSIRPEHLNGFPLSTKVKLNTLFPNRYLYPGKCDESVISLARTGLPIGAMLSQQIASGLIESLLQGIVGEGIAAICYVDDVAICARTAGEIEAIAKAIQSRFNDNPAGPLKFKHIVNYDAATGFEFLKFSFTIARDGRCVISLSRKAWDGLYNRLRVRLALDTFARFEAVLDASDDYVARWLESHRPWRANAGQREEARSIVAVAASDHWSGR